MVASLHARVDGGAISERRMLDLAEVPEHKRGLWLPVVEDKPAHNADIARLSGPEEIIEAARVVKRWSVVAFSNAELKARVSDERDRRIGRGVAVTLSDGRTFGVQTRNEVDFRNINGLASKAILMTMAGDKGTLTFRDMGDIQQALTAGQMLELAQQVAARIDAIYKAAWAMKDMDAVPADYTDNARWPE